jgi:N-acetylmuramic acid 6-phosphate (MurNAc-6-P) etherase
MDTPPLSLVAASVSEIDLTIAVAISGSSPYEASAIAL